MVDPDPGLAMLIEAVARSDRDPLQRFVEVLPDDLRRYAEETVRLREEFLSNAHRMLAAENPREAAGYAEWVSRHAHEVAYRWVMLTKSVQRWAMYDVESVIHLRIRPEGSDP